MLLSDLPDDDRHFWQKIVLGKLLRGFGPIDSGIGDMPHMMLCIVCITLLPSYTLPNNTRKLIIPDHIGEFNIVS
jgi:hypothetical protein